VRDPQHLRYLSRPGDYFVSLDLTDGYYTLGIREEGRDFFTVNYRGELWRVACLPQWAVRVRVLLLQTHAHVHQLLAAGAYATDRQDGDTL
jgi:hypothetical protein